MTTDPATMWTQPPLPFSAPLEPMTEMPPEPVPLDPTVAPDADLILGMYVATLDVQRSLQGLALDVANLQAELDEAADWLRVTAYVLVGIIAATLIVAVALIGWRLT